MELDFYFYNSLARKKVLFKPLKPNCLKLYVCGVTTYDRCHIGHARTYLVFDGLVRYFQSRDWTVEYVRNITDIDDKIIQKAKTENQTPESIAQKYTQEMQADFERLNLLVPFKQPKATESIGLMIDLIQKLWDQKLAYQGQKTGDIYFSTEKYADYGQLSNQNLDALESGNRVEIGSDKKSPLDFVLWKSAKPEEPSWDSPWGLGRPGWHLECSAMAMDCLGLEFDMHGGGQDLLFPHHENERAQACGASHKSFARYWLHTGFLNLKSEKMSKSLGNTLSIQDVLAQFPAEVLRLLVLSSHYRSPIDYDDSKMQHAQASLNRLYQALRVIESNQTIHDSADFPELSELSHYEKRFHLAMQDDLNTPVAMAVLFELAHVTHRAQSRLAARLLRKLANSLGLLLQEPAVYFQSRTERQASFSDITIQTIEEKIEARTLARTQKNFKLADQIRAELLAHGIELEDTPDGKTTWRYSETKAC